jgi:hypothetical protein
LFAIRGREDQNEKITIFSPKKYWVSTRILTATKNPYFLQGERKKSFSDGTGIDESLQYEP